eukprot:15455735-Alexandrium_andersonii.AAC.1
MTISRITCGDGGRKVFPAPSRRGPLLRLIQTFPGLRAIHNPEIRSIAEFGYNGSSPFANR